MKKAVFAAVLAVPSSLWAFGISLPKLEKGSGPVHGLMDRLDRVEADVKSSNASIASSAGTLRGLASGTPAGKALAPKRAKVEEMKRAAKDAAARKAAQAAEQALLGEEITAFSKADAIAQIKATAAGQVKASDPARVALGLADAAKSSKRAAEESKALVQEIPQAKDGVASEFSNPLEAARVAARLVGAPAQLGQIESQASVQAVQIAELTRAFEALAGK